MMTFLRRWLALLCGVFFFGSFGCGLSGNSEPPSKVRGFLLVTAIGCGDAGECSLDSQCNEYAYEGGHGLYCAPTGNACGVLTCPPKTKCLCLWVQPPQCGCAAVE